MADPVVKPAAPAAAPEAPAAPAEDHKALMHEAAKMLRRDIAGASLAERIEAYLGK
jgi:hypothetical protein